MRNSYTRGGRGCQARPADSEYYREEEGDFSDEDHGGSGARPRRSRRASAKKRYEDLPMSEESGSDQGEEIVDWRKLSPRSQQRYKRWVNIWVATCSVVIDIEAMAC
jgi:hypothetical protein